MHSRHLKALHAKRMTSVKHPENPIYPYLLKNILVRYPNFGLDQRAQHRLPLTNACI